eukprot:3797375-Prymnesium_polylepis.1
MLFLAWYDSRLIPECSKVEPRVNDSNGDASEGKCIDWRLEPSCGTRLRDQHRQRLIRHQTHPRAPHSVPCFGIDAGADFGAGVGVGAGIRSAILAGLW